MHLHPNCMRMHKPLVETIVFALAADRWPDWQLLPWAFVVVYWVCWIAQEIYGMPIDIFEDYRNTDENEGLTNPPPKKP